MKCRLCKNNNPENSTKCIFCGSTLMEDRIVVDPITEGPSEGSTGGDSTGGGSSNSSNTSMDRVKAIALAKKAIVKINSISVTEENLLQNCEGTGFFLEYQGKKFLVTNYHVIQNSIEDHGRAFYTTTPEVDRTQNKYSLIPLTFDELNDIAICKVNYPKLQNLNFLSLEDDIDKLLQGEEVFTIGNPNGASFIATSGTISSTSYPSEMAMNKVLVNLDASVGSSGGPAVRVRDCKVIGITSGGFSSTVDLKRVNANTAVGVDLIFEGLQRGKGFEEILQEFCGDSFDERKWNPIKVQTNLPGQCICTSGEAIAMLLNEYLEERA